jgi:glucosamine--fructose-6-phosphate aminotransferase (isomerizing)
MCGIFGFFETNNTDIFYDLGKYSETRGKEASGFVRINNFDETIHKFPTPFTSPKVKSLLKNYDKKEVSATFIGHTRLKTHGDQNHSGNNQPVTTKDISLVHNGIIINYQDIAKEFDLNLESKLDSEVVSLLMDNHLKKLSFKDALISTIEILNGEVSVSGSYKKGELYFLYSNTGSLYYLVIDNKIQFFSSEEWISNTIKNKYRLHGEIKKLKENTGLILNSNFEITDIFEQECLGVESKHIDLDSIIEDFNKKQITKPIIKRCKICILPDTVPLIKFNEKNICNYCLNFKKHKPKDIEILLKKLRKEKNIVVGLSGGRDSSYGLSYLKEKLASEFVAVSFDWGMVTELARRNQARVVGGLGVEHVWVSADINKKRENIRKNFLAWLSDPNMGMVPILMAGDKEWQSQLFKAADNKNSKFIVQFVCPYEFTYFKYGFAGIEPFFTSKIQSLNFVTKYYVTIKLSLFYIKNFIKNPKYLNSTLFDTVKGFFSYFFQTKNIISFFEYLDYDEKEVNRHLQQKFSWELDKSTPTSWRIGDGTAPIYNYIYWIYAGFTENDFFRSNQIRQGKLLRSDALNMIEIENQPRYDAIKEYCELIDVDYDFVMKKFDIIKSNSLVKEWEIE